MIIIETHIVKKIEKPVRFLDYLIGLFKQLPTKSGIKKAIARGEIIVNGVQVESGRFLKIGDRIDLLDLQLKLPKKYNLNIEVVFEDDYIIIINKPSGISVSGNSFKTIENAMIGIPQKSTQPDSLKWAKPVHRLDNMTSGILILAKTSNAHKQFGKLFETKQIQKTYKALVVGKPNNSGVINKDVDNKKSITEYKLIESVRSLKNNYVSLLELMPKTGRTHQIRIHLSSIGHPIIGDKLYGQEGNILLHKGLFLAAIGIEFKHPFTHKQVTLDIDQPEKFNKFMLRQQNMFTKYDK